MQLMTFISAYLFTSAAEQGAEKPLQKISYNLGNISNALSVTWLCDWKEHFIWRFAIFWCYWHYTITFPVIYHIVEYQDKFASPYIYHITGKYRDRFHQLLYTKWCPLLTGDVQQLFKDLSWTDSAPRGFYPAPPPYIETEIFPLTSALPSKRRSRGLSAFCSRYSKWTENCLLLGNLNAVRPRWGVSGGGRVRALERFEYWLAAVVFKKLLKTFSF